MSCSSAAVRLDRSRGSDRLELTATQGIGWQHESLEVARAREEVIDRCCLLQAHAGAVLLISEEEAPPEGGPPQRIDR